MPQFRRGECVRFNHRRTFMVMDRNPDTSRTFNLRVGTYQQHWRFAWQVTAMFEPLPGRPRNLAQFLHAAVYLERTV